MIPPINARQPGATLAKTSAETKAPAKTDAPTRHVRPSADVASSTGVSLVARGATQLQPGMASPLDLDPEPLPHAESKHTSAVSAGATAATVHRVVTTRDELSQLARELQGNSLGPSLRLELNRDEWKVEETNQLQSGLESNTSLEALSVKINTSFPGRVCSACANGVYKNKSKSIKTLDIEYVGTPKKTSNALWKLLSPLVYGKSSLTSLALRGIPFDPAGKGSENDFLWFTEMLAINKTLESFEFPEPLDWQGVSRDAERKLLDEAVAAKNGLGGEPLNGARTWTFAPSTSARSMDSERSGAVASALMAQPGTASRLDRAPAPAVQETKHNREHSGFAAAHAAVPTRLVTTPEQLTGLVSDLSNNVVGSRLVETDEQFSALLSSLRNGTVGPSLDLVLNREKWSRQQVNDWARAMKANDTVLDLRVVAETAYPGRLLFSIAAAVKDGETKLRSVDFAYKGVPKKTVNDMWTYAKDLMSPKSQLTKVMLRNVPFDHDVADNRPEKRVDSRGFGKFIAAVIGKQSLECLVIEHDSVRDYLEECCFSITCGDFRRLELRGSGIDVGRLELVLNRCAGVKRPFHLVISKSSDSAIARQQEEMVKQFGIETKLRFEAERSAGAGAIAGATAATPPSGPAVIVELI